MPRELSKRGMKRNQYFCWRAVSLMRGDCCEIFFSLEKYQKLPITGNGASKYDNISRAMLANLLNWKRWTGKNVNSTFSLGWCSLAFFSELTMRWITDKGMFSSPKIYHLHVQNRRCARVAPHRRTLNERDFWFGLFCFSEALNRITTGTWT